jgi:hypothetical protein
VSRLTGGRGPKPVIGVDGVQNKKNRPDIRDQIPRGVLFHEEGPTGWGRRRDLRDHKGGKSESNFEHLHDKFTEEEA